RPAASGLGPVTITAGGASVVGPFGPEAATGTMRFAPAEEPELPFDLPKPDAGAAAADATPLASETTVYPAVVAGGAAIPAPHQNDASRAEAHSQGEAAAPANPALGDVYAAVLAPQRRPARTDDATERTRQDTDRDAGTPTMPEAAE
ncbi:MAG: hypothetical protein AAGF49_16640, partial [Pseudomonadota bacterium]